MTHIVQEMGHEPGTSAFYLARATLHLEDKRFSECIDDCRSYMDLVEDGSSVNDLLATAHYLHAREQNASGNHTMALDSLNEAISLNPAASYYAERAELHRRLRNHREVEADFDRALEKDPEEWAALNGKYEYQRDLGGLELAWEFFRDLSVWKGSALHHYCLGRVYFALGDFQGAVSCLTVAIVTDQVWPVEWPVGHSPHLLRGVAHLMLGDCEAAARHLVSEIAGDAGERAALSERFDAGREMENYAWALEDFERVASMRSRFLDVYRLIGDTHIGGSRTNEVVRAFENLLSMYPEQGQAGEMRARARQRLEQFAHRGDPSDRKPRRAGLSMPEDGV